MAIPGKLGRFRYQPAGLPGQGKLARFNYESPSSPSAPATPAGQVQRLSIQPYRPGGQAAVSESAARVDLIGLPEGWGAELRSAGTDAGVAALLAGPGDPPQTRHASVSAGAYNLVVGPMNAGESREGDTSGTRPVRQIDSSRAVSLGLALDARQTLAVEWKDGRLVPVAEGVVDRCLALARRVPWKPVGVIGGAAATGVLVTYLVMRSRKGKPGAK
jgi:hypothetical protein